MQGFNISRQRITLGLILLGSCACKPQPNGGSSLAIVEGEPVTQPEQSPGTYGITAYYSQNGQDVPFMHGTANVLEGGDKLITAGHVLADADPHRQVLSKNPIPEGAAVHYRVTDYTGREIHRFDKNDSTFHMNREYTGRNDGSHMFYDTAGVNLNNPISADNLTHGTAKLGTAYPRNLYFVGNGLSSINSQDSGTLRFGSNDQFSVADGNLLFDGPMFSEQNTGRAGFAAGDSGGGAYAGSANGPLIGIVTSNSPGMTRSGFEPVLSGQTQTIPEPQYGANLGVVSLLSDPSNQALLNSMGVTGPQ